VAGRSSRRKGKRGEYIVRDLLRKWGFEARRGVASANEADISHDIPDYHLEVKNVEALNIWAALAQAERDAIARTPTPAAHNPHPHVEPVVFFKRNSTKVYAALDGEKLLRLLRLESSYEEFKEINDAQPQP